MALPQAKIKTQNAKLKQIQKPNSKTSKWDHHRFSCLVLISILFDFWILQFGSWYT